MSLGIVLHAILLFVPYRDPDGSGHSILEWVVEIVHGFRMPLFFLLSGYFTALLLSRRGVLRTAWQRVLRIGVPLIIGWYTLIPLVPWLGEEMIVKIIRSGNLPAYYYTPEFAAETAAAGEPAPPGLVHLWFLWYLLILFVIIVAVVGLVRLALRMTGRDAVPSWLKTLAIGVFVVTPVITEATTPIAEFGPSTESTWTPSIGIVMYYLAFYSVGALLFGRNANGAPAIYRLQKWWPWLLGAGVAVFHPLAISLTSVAWLSASAQVAYAWVVTFGMIGLFKAALSKERFSVRFLSDSSYWLYLSHLPVILLLQGWFGFFTLPGILEATLIAVITTVSMLVVYVIAVRYTPLGWLLNGRRSFAADRQAVASR